MLCLRLSTKVSKSVVTANDNSIQGYPAANASSAKGMLRCYIPRLEVQLPQLPILYLACIFGDPGDPAVWLLHVLIHANFTSHTSLPSPPTHAHFIISVSKEAISTVFSISSSVFSFERVMRKWWRHHYHCLITHQFKL